MKTVEVPRLDRRIVFLRAVVEENEAGELEALAWDEFASARASYEPVSDGERLRAAAVEQKTDARFRVRWTSRLAMVTGEFRFRFDGSDWRITGIKEIGRRQFLEISAWRLVGS
ncbi:phage head closure protein [Albibacillus kandeliae]|uniref:phage head closure protein n=1 Tax=Albibacillus kandeliae TaxID=2174228 RepID=UPI000D68DED1|nr:phage head closure protein [Albibacillus kandeliae]